MGIKYFFYKGCSSTKWGGGGWGGCLERGGILCFDKKFLLRRQKYHEVSRSQFTETNVKSGAL